MIHDILLPFFTIVLSYTGFGAFIVYILSCLEETQNKENGLFEHIGLWFLIGAGIMTLLQFIVSLLDVHIQTSLFLFVPFSLAGFVLQRKQIWKDLGNATKTPLHWKAYWLGIILFLFLLFSRSYSRPFYAWDAIAFWDPKMFALWVDQKVTPKTFIDFNHPEYPLLLPLTGANAYTVMGQPNESSAKVVIFGFTIALFLLVGSFLSSKLPWVKALFFTLLFSSLFILREHIGGEFVGTADIFIGIYVVAGSIFLLKRQLLYAIVLWSLAAWCKSEGLVWAGTTLVLVSLFYSRKRILHVIAGGLLMLPWFLYNRAIGQSSSQYFNFSQLYPRPWVEYFIYSIHAFREEFRNVQKWNLLFFFFLCATFTNLKNIFSDKRLTIIFTALAVQIISYLVIFTITPEEQASFIAASISRLTLHVAPTVLIVTAYLFSKEFSKHEKHRT